MPTTFPAFSLEITSLTSVKVEGFSLMGGSDMEIVTL